MYSEKTTIQSLNALKEYFNTIEQTGYLKYSVVNGILGLILVDTFLNTDINVFVTEEDYKIMAKFLYCLYGTNCLIPYPQFYKEIPQVGSVVPDLNGFFSYRNTEEDLLRFIENKFNVRIAETGTKYWNN